MSHLLLLTEPLPKLLLEKGVTLNDIVGRMRQAIPTDPTNAAVWLDRHLSSYDDFWTVALRTHFVRTLDNPELLVESVLQSDDRILRQRINWMSWARFCHREKRSQMIEKIGYGVANTDEEYLPLMALGHLGSAAAVYQTLKSNFVFGLVPGVNADPDDVRRYELPARRAYLAAYMHCSDDALMREDCLDRMEQFAQCIMKVLDGPQNHGRDQLDDFGVTYLPLTSDALKSLVDGCRHLSLKYDGGYAHVVNHLFYSLGPQQSTDLSSWLVSYCEGVHAHSALQALSLVNTPQVINQLQQYHNASICGATRAYFVAIGRQKTVERVDTLLEALVETNLTEAAGPMAVWALSECAEWCPELVSHLERYTEHIDVHVRAFAYLGLAKRGVNIDLEKLQTEATGAEAHINDYPARLAFSIAAFHLGNRQLLIDVLAACGSQPLLRLDTPYADALSDALHLCGEGGLDLLKLLQRDLHVS